MNGNELERLAIVLELQDRQAKAGLDAIGNQAQKIADESSKAWEGFGQRLSRSFERIGRDLQRVGQNMSLSVSAPILAAGAAAFRATQQLGNYADRILDLAQMTGLSIERLQEFENVARIAGVSTDSFTSAAVNLSRRLQGMDHDSGRSAETMQRLGISVRDSTGEMRSMDDLMPEIMQRLGSMENITERNSLATAIFGTAYASLAPVFALTAEQMEGARLEAHAMGQVMSRESLEAANNYRIGLEQLRASVSLAGRELTIALIPTMQSLVETANIHLVPAVRQVASGISSSIDLFNQLNDFTKGFIGSVVGLTVAAGPLVLGFGKLLPVLVNMRVALLALGGPIGLAIGAAALIHRAWQRDLADLQSITERAMSRISSFFTSTADSVRFFFERNRAYFVGIGETTQNAATYLSGRYAFLVEKVTGLAEDHGVQFGFIQSGISALPNFFETAFQKIARFYISSGAEFQAFATFVGDIVTAIGNLFRRFGSFVREEFIEPLKEAFNLPAINIPSIGMPLIPRIRIPDPDPPSYDEVLEAARTAQETLESTFAKVDIPLPGIPNYNEIVEAARGAQDSLVATFTRIVLPEVEAADYSNVTAAATEAQEALATTFTQVAIPIPETPDYSAIVDAAEDAHDEIVAIFTRDIPDIAIPGVVSPDYSELVREAEKAETDITRTFTRLGAAIPDAIAFGFAGRISTVGVKIARAFGFAVALPWEDELQGIEGITVLSWDNIQAKISEATTSIGEALESWGIENPFADLETEAVASLQALQAEMQATGEVWATEQPRLADTRQLSESQVALRGLIVDSWELIKTTWREAITEGTFLNTQLRRIAGGFMVALNSLRPLTDFIDRALIKAINDTRWAVALMSRVIQGDFVGAWQLIVDDVSNYVTGIVDALKEAVNLPANLAKVREAAEDVYNKFKAGLEQFLGKGEGGIYWLGQALLTSVLDGINDANELFKTAAEWIIGLFQEGLRGAGATWQWAKDLGAEFVENFVAGVVGVADSVFAPLNDWIERVRESFSFRAVGSSGGRDFVDGVVEGIEEGEERLRQAGRSAGGWVPEGWDEETESDSPSRVMMRRGRDLLESVALGIQQGQPVALRAILESAKDIFKAWQDFWEQRSPAKKMLDSGADLMTSIATGIESETPAAAGAALSAAQAVTAPFEAEITAAVERYAQSRARIHAETAQALADIERVQARTQQQAGQILETLSGNGEALTEAFVDATDAIGGVEAAITGAGNAAEVAADKFGLLLDVTRQYSERLLDQFEFGERGFFDLEAEFEQQISKLEAKRDDFITVGLANLDKTQWEAYTNIRDRIRTLQGDLESLRRSVTRPITMPEVQIDLAGLVALPELAPELSLTQLVDITVVPQIDLAAPVQIAGRVWDRETGLWHEAGAIPVLSLAQAVDITVEPVISLAAPVQIAGRVWDRETGLWHERGPVPILELTQPVNITVVPQVELDPDWLKQQELDAWFEDIQSKAWGTVEGLTGAFATMHAEIGGIFNSLVNNTEISVSQLASVIQAGIGLMVDSLGMLIAGGENAAENIIFSFAKMAVGVVKSIGQMLIAQAAQLVAQGIIEAASATMAWKAPGTFAAAAKVGAMGVGVTGVGMGLESAIPGPSAGTSTRAASRADTPGTSTGRASSAPSVTYQAIVNQTNHIEAGLDNPRTRAQLRTMIDDGLMSALKNLGAIPA